MTFPVFASGDVLNASDMNAVGLWLVKSQTIGSAVSSVAVTGAFTADYENYLITVSGGVASTTNILTLQMGATTSNYKWSLIYNTYGGATITATSSTTGSSFNYAGIGTTTSLAASATILSPQLAEWTFFRAPWSASAESGIAGGVIENTTQYTDFTLGVSTGTITGGT
ncbi:MAG: hypothetical protein ACO3DI_06570, partial [Ilumatobacteraceae bacterium]